LKDLFNKARKYFTSVGDVWLFFRVAGWILILPVMLRRYDLGEMIRRITPRGATARYDTHKLTVFVNWWLNRNVAMFEPTCFRRSLVLYRFMCESGEPVRIHYGIKNKSEGGNEGHSWLSIDGKPFGLDGESAGDYRETFSFPPEGVQ